MAALRHAYQAKHDHHVRGRNRAQPCPAREPRRREGARRAKPGCIRTAAEATCRRRLAEALALPSMSSGPVGWLPLVFTTLGAGIVGSVIATYGGQARARRKARSKVVACLQKLEIARLTRETTDGLDYDQHKMGELRALCVLAGVPQYLMNLYQAANEGPKGPARTHTANASPEEVKLSEMTDTLGVSLAGQAALVLVWTVWHPWLSLLFRRPYASILKRRTLAAFPMATYGQEFRGTAWFFKNWKAAYRALEAKEPGAADRILFRDDEDQSPGEIEPAGIADA
jgi:hypothetical protein